MRTRAPSPHTRSQLIPLALSLVRDAGHSTQPLVRRFRLPKSAAEESATLLPLATLRAFFEACEQLTGDPLFGFHLFERMPRGLLGLIEYVSQTAPTVRANLNALVRYTPLRSEVLVTALRQKGDLVEFHHWIPGEPECLGRQPNECFIALLITRLRLLIGMPDFVPERTWLAHGAPRAPAELAAALSVPAVEFGAETNGIAVPREFLDVPLVTADPRLHAILVDHAEHLLALRRGQTRLVAQVRQTIRDVLRHELPTLSRAARAMGVQPRSLQRWLTAEKTRFVDLVDAVREELARRLLREAKLSIGEIAFELHYSDESSFVRAFRRWTGQTPGAFRGAIL